MKNNHIPLLLALLASLFLTVPALEAAAKVHQFFPNQPVLIGQSLFWSIKLHYPLSESYSVQLHPPAGTRMEVANRNVYEERSEISAMYSIRIVAQDLHISDVPAITIVDQKGQSIVLTGKPITVATISGSSVDIRDPGRPVFESAVLPKSQRWSIVPFGLLVLLLIFFHYRSRTPRARLLQDLQKSLKEIRRGRLPFSLWSVLRSELLWGFSAESRTGTELKQAAGNNHRLVAVAEMLELMERARYSGKTVQVEPESERSLIAAIEWLKNRGKTR